uniref:hypothetical protein n=1 Tax=Candidatus Enterovibrio escicola TaxID=1927127 RepID=UPI001CC314EA
ALNRRHRLHNAFHTSFNADQFIASLEATTADLIEGRSDEIPLLGGIPITDLMVFADKRLDEMSKLTSSNAKIKSQELIEKVIQVGDLSCMPISIATADLGNGRIHIPTFGEIFYDKLSNHIIKSAHDNRSKGLKVIPLFENFVERLSSVDRKFGFESIPLAIIGLQLSYGHSKSLSIFNKNILAIACIHLIESQIPYLNDAVTENLLNSAHELDINLRDLKISNSISLYDFFEASQKQDLYDKYDSLCVLNDAMRVVNQNHDRISHNYNPNAYFDM